MLLNALARLALIFLIVSIATSARADESDIVCFPARVVARQLAMVAEQVHGQIDTLNGNEAEAFLAVVNAAPPESDIHSDALLMVVHPQGAAIVAFMQDGQLCGPIRLAPDLFGRAMKAAKGAPS